QLLNEGSVVHLFDDARVLHSFYLAVLLQLRQEVAVAQVVYLVDEEVEGARLHYIEALFLDRLLRFVDCHMSNLLNTGMDLIRMNAPV
ncbi:MAG: hypothetical protein ACKPKO_09920, partial [Candidatus Fonsibacter sp.]